MRLAESSYNGVYKASVRPAVAGRPAAEMRVNLYIGPCPCLSMSQNMSEMLEAWEKSRAEQKKTWDDKSRFYDLRKRPTGRKIHSEGGMTPEGEALYAMREGWDQENAEPMDEA